MNYVATNTTDFNVPENKWIASLSDGTTVFDDIGPPGTISAWRRLKAHVSNHKLKLTGLRLQAFGQTISLPPGSEGYWHSKRVSAIVGSGSHDFTSYDFAVGYVAEGYIHITWVCQDGHIRAEVRELKEEDVGHISNKI
jgi:hypothetical protein